MGTKRKISVQFGTKGVTLGEAFNEYMGDKVVQGIADKTIRNYEQAYQYFLELEFDNDDSVEVNEITKTHIQQWIDAMRSKRMKVVTLNTYLRNVRAFLYWCMDDERGYIEYSYKINLVKGQEPLPKVFSDEEVEQLLLKPVNIKDFVEWRTWAISNWAVGTGNRASTICELKLGDLDFENHEIALRHTKNKKAQVIAFPPSLERVIKVYIKACRSNEDDEAWLFPNQGNDKLTYNALAHSFSRYCKDRGVEHTNIHGLRHYYATNHTRSGGSGEALQRQLGHSTYTMTQRYINLTNADFKDETIAHNPLEKHYSGVTRRKKVKMNG
jgi:integrase/recombinase XerD